MRLKTLEISGFKSFADQTRIDFLPGMTGIVGPNGSGKSNIAEAVRWVLGEQSAKSLRGTKMPDIIFGGSSDRHALNRAAVTITLDNSDHYLKSAYTELTISRRLYRSGESEYLLNGQTCRLKDVTELLMDSGMGQDSFSIISQGRVAAIFNSKPEDRRSIIEEVAGVYKYRKHKEKAQRELDGTMGDLHRVEDIIAELEERLKPLEEQSDLARDYLDQKRRFAILDRTQLVRQLQAETTQKATVDKTVRQKGGLVHEQQYAQQQQGKQVQTLQKKQHDLLAQKDTLQAQLVTTTKAVEQRQGQVNLTSEQRQNQEREQKRLAHELASTQQHQTALAATIEQDQAALAALRAEMATHQTKVKTLKRATDDQVLARLRDQLDHLRTAYFDQKQQVASWRNQQQYLQQDQARQQQRGQRLTSQLADLKQTAQTTAQRVQELTTKASALHDQLTTAEQAYDTEAGQYQQQETAYRQLQRQWQAALEVYQRAKTQAAGQRAALAEYGGFYQGVRAVLRQREQFTGLLGAVSELLQVPADYTTAIEYTLGGQLQQIVVDTPTTAKAAMTYLKQHRAGRATFLPVDTVHQRHLDATTQRTLAQMDGVVGVGSDLVDITPAAQPILNYLLGTTILAHDLDAAVAISQRLHHRYRVVSLAGDVISASGAMTGGQAKHASTSVLRQRQDLAHLEASLTTMTTQLQERETQVKTHREALQASDQRSQKLRATMNELQPQCRQVDDQLATAKTAAEQANRQLKAAQLDLQQATATDQDQQGNDLQAKIDQGVATSAQQERELADLQTQLKDATAQQASRQTVLTEQQTWLAGAQEREQQRQQALAQHQKELASDQAHQRGLKHDQAQLKQDEGLTPQEAAAQLKQAQADQTQTQHALTANDDALTTVNDQLAQATAANDRATGLLQVANDDLHKAQVTQTRLAALIDQQQGDLAEKYQLSLAAAAKDVSDLPSDQLTSQLKLLKRGLAEIGPVNVNAIDEYKDVRQRYDFLTQQRDDLLTARDQLTATMSELDNQVKQRFERSFKQVAKKFTATFKQMFNGGTAELVLTDPDDLLTTGIDIMAQPPGKKFQNMGLLSGGERALTAITLLFTILQVQPVPFCILDEVEAALDPANVTRFARYIHQFQAQTQFIVITHRKETMVQADVLYGVTMQESGVSKMVAVDLDQASTVEGK